MFHRTSTCHLQLASGKNDSNAHLCNKEWAPPVFHHLMARRRFQKLMKHLEFTISSVTRKELNKFFLILYAWNAFIQGDQTKFRQMLNEI